jgi:hypothetical protein
MVLAPESKPIRRLLGAHTNVLLQETFCYGVVLLRRCFVWRRFVEETFCAETFCMCAVYGALKNNISGLCIFCEKVSFLLLS